MRHLTSQQLTATADEQLTGVSLEVVRRHLGICPECRTRLERFAHQREALRETLGTDPGEPFWDELFERIESRLDTIDKKPARAERPPPTLVAVPPPASPPVATPSQPPALRVVTVSTLEPPPEPAPGARTPLRGVLIGVAVLAALLAAMAIAVLATPAPETPVGTHISWLPRLTRTLRVTAERLVAPIAMLVRRPPAAHREAPSASLATATPPPAIAPAPAPPFADAPVTHASPLLPVAKPAGDRKNVPLAAPTAPGVRPRPHAPIAATTSPPKPEPVKPSSLAPASKRPAPAVDEARWPLFCGQVLDAAGQPIAGARVQLADLDLGGRTDRRGRFCLAMPPGERTLTISALGFANWRELVNISSGTTEIRVTLHDAR